MFENRLTVRIKVLDKRALLSLRLFYYPILFPGESSLPRKKRTLFSRNIAKYS